MAGGFRGIGFVHSPLLSTTGHTFAPLLWVGDWCALLQTALLQTLHPP